MAMTNASYSKDYEDNERQMAKHNSIAPYDQGPQPGYGLQMGQPGTTNHTTVVVTEEQPYAWNWCVLVTAVISCFLCPVSQMFIYCFKINSLVIVLK